MEHNCVIVYAFGIHIQAPLGPELARNTCSTPILCDCRIHILSDKRVSVHAQTVVPVFGKFDFYDELHPLSCRYFHGTNGLRGTSETFRECHERCRKVISATT
ncbi:hypothetical protein ATCV1_z185L [Acanthocystis turfacea chlorella virus 1]|uniref:Uncharacterized protein z185L n=1 Tax=Chlorovirus heliozoae TaxID=322019 RepID=A7K8E5_9PHYC|nr:hypothetical protein ATCV1_z185L [Acanthocystis turfacea chlorella virus 1]ABT16319.1 hypothetical protein ATCV1_z185L [Acanthocystis turfacea chlorella virus 1]